jgi:NTP pyrophosphatase (non-canonical NTP hydrolase)
MENFQQEIKTFCDERDWNQFHNPKDLSISLMLEAAELLELFQWGRDIDFEAVSTDIRNNVADELADIFYWVLLLSQKFEIDLASAFDNKMAKNIAKYPIDKSKGKHSKYTEFENEKN